MTADYFQQFSQNSINTICQSTVPWWFAIHGPNVGHFLSDSSLGKLLLIFSINSRNVFVFSKFQLGSLWSVPECVRVQLKGNCLWCKCCAAGVCSLVCFSFLISFFLSHELCCPSEWVSVTIESEPWTNSADFDPMFPDLWKFPRDRVFFRVFNSNVA